MELPKLPGENGRVKWWRLVGFGRVMFFFGFVEQKRICERNKDYPAWSPFRPTQPQSIFARSLSLLRGYRIA